MAFHSKRNAGLLVGALGMLSLGVAVRVWGREWLDPRVGLELIRSVQGRVWAIPAFVMTYLALVSAFVPANFFHLVAGAAWGFPDGWVVSLLAFNLTSNLQFWWARRFGREVVARWAGERRMARIEAGLAQEGIRAAMLVRLLPLPNAAVNLVAGASPIRWRDFALGSLIGTMPLISVTTFFAAALVEGAADAQRAALIRVLIGGALVVALALGSRMWARRAGHVS